MNASLTGRDMQELTTTSLSSPVTAAQTSVMVAGAGVFSGGFLLTAAYVRQGPDLILRGEDGQAVLIKDYFAKETLADLIGDHGETIPADWIQLLAGPLAPGQYAQISGGAGLRAIGKVSTFKGAATVKHPDGTSAALAKDATIFAKDVIETSANAALGITFEDGSSFSLGSKGRLIIDEMIYDPQGADNKSALGVMSGAFSLVSGNIAKMSPGAMQVKTPVGTIGIRGTTVSGNVGSEGRDSYFTLMPDADGHIGEISLTNGAGTVTLNQSGFSLQIGSFIQAPQQVYLSPGQIQSLYGEALSSHPSPITLPPPAPPADSHLPVDPGQPDQSLNDRANESDANTSESFYLNETFSIADDSSLLFLLELAYQMDEQNQDDNLFDELFNVILQDVPLDDEIDDPIDGGGDDAVNHDPTFDEDAATSLSVVHNQSVSGNVQATDADGDALTYSVETNPNNGTLVLNSDGTFTYTASNSVTAASTADSFEVSVDDGNGGTITRTVTIDITDTAPTLTQVTPKLAGLTFDGVDDIINIPSPVKFGGANNFSIGMWVKPTAAGMLYRQEVSGGLGLYTSVLANGGLLFGLDDNGGVGWDWQSAAAGTVTLGEWVHLTFVKSGSNTEIFVNGSSIGTDPVGANQLAAATSTGNVHFGDDVGGNFFTGQLAQLAVYSDGLSAANVLALMQGVPSTTNLEEYYTFTTSNGTSFADESVNTHDLTLSGGTAPVISLTGTVSATDPDAGDTVTLSVAANPTNGTLDFNTGTGAYTYTPNFPSSSDSFSITATDDHTVASTGVIRLPGLPTSGDDTITGTTSNEYIYGGPGKDNLDGGQGNDTLYGGFGNDTLTGGAGVDVFVEQTGSSKQTSNENMLDVVMDFNWSTENDHFKIYNNSGAVVTIGGAYHAGSAASVSNGVTAAFADRDGTGAGSTGLGTNEAAFFTVSATTYLVVNDATAGYQSGQDVVLQINGGDAIASDTTLTVSSYFS
jgi:VCBS repeat-containing protein